MNSTTAHAYQRAEFKENSMQVMYPQDPDTGLSAGALAAAIESDTFNQSMTLQVMGEWP